MDINLHMTVDCPGLTELAEALKHMSFIPAEAPAEKPVKKAKKAKAEEPVAEVVETVAEAVNVSTDWAEAVATQVPGSVVDEIVDAPVEEVYKPKYTFAAVSGAAVKLRGEQPDLDLNGVLRSFGVESLRALASADPKLLDECAEKLKALGAQL